MPILHRILPCLAPPAAAAGAAALPNRRRRPGARGRAGQPHHLGRHAGRAGPRTGAGALSRPLHPAPAPPCRPRSSGASTPCRSRGQSDEDAQAEQRRLRQDARTRRPTPGSGAGDARDRPPTARPGRPRGLARVVLAQPAAGADDLVLDEPLQSAPRATWAPSSAAKETAPSGRTRWASSATCWRDHPLAGHAAVPGQRAERGRQDQRTMRAS